MLNIDCSYLIANAIKIADKNAKLVDWKPKVHYNDLEDYEEQMNELEQYIFEYVHSTHDIVSDIQSGEFFFGIISRLLRIIKKPQEKLENSTREEEWARGIALTFETEFIRFCRFVSIYNLNDEDNSVIINYLTDRFDRENNITYYPGTGFESFHLSYNCSECGRKTGKIWGYDSYSCQDCLSDSDN